MDKIDVEFTFPDIVLMERSALVHTLVAAKNEKWFSEERCMRVMANAFRFNAFDVDEEKQQIQKEAKEDIDRELETNRHRSLAETKLQVWQSYFSQAGAKEEQSQLGYSPTAAGDAGGGGAEEGAPNSSAPTRSPVSSGGMSEQDRASVRQGGR